MRVGLQVLTFVVAVLLLSSVMDWGLTWVPEWVRNALHLAFLAFVGWGIVTRRFGFVRLDS